MWKFSSLTKSCILPLSDVTPLSRSLSPLSLGHPILYPEKHNTLLTLWLRTARLTFLKQHSLVAQLVKNLPAIMQVDPFLTQGSNPESPAESYVSLPSIKNPHVTFHIKSKFLGLTPKTRPSQSPATLLLQVCKYGVGRQTDRQTDRHTPPFPPRVMLVLNPESLSLSVSLTHTRPPLH